MIEGDKLNIKYTATRNASFSVWSFDEPWLLAGETATIFDYYVAGANPLYVLRKDKDPESTKAVHRSLLLEYGEIEGANPK